MALILSRKQGESVILGDGDTKIIVTVQEIRGDSVRLGFTDETGRPIHREEVYDLLVKEGKLK